MYLIIAILLANLISIAVVYQFIKKLEKKQILIFIAVSVAFMYISISIVYWLSGFGVDPIIHEASKNFVLYVFVPVNVILFVPYFAFQYMKVKQKELKSDSFAKKMPILLVLFCFVLIVEYFYCRNIQTNITNMKAVEQEEKTQNTLELEKEETINEQTNSILNELE